MQLYSLLKIDQSRVMKNDYFILSDIKMFREKHFNKFQTLKVKNISVNLIFIFKFVALWKRY